MLTDLVAAWQEGRKASRAGRKLVDGEPGTDPAHVEGLRADCAAAGVPCVETNTNRPAPAI